MGGISLHHDSLRLFVRSSTKPSLEIAARSSSLGPETGTAWIHDRPGKNFD